MSKCCNEPGCDRATPILVRRSGLTGEVYVLTRYHRTDGRIVADVKHNVTDEVYAVVNEIVSENRTA